MTLIDGFGDEVTIVISIIVISAVLFLAWISTHTTDIPFFRLVIVNLMNRNRRTGQVRNAADSETTPESTHDQRRRESNGDVISETDMLPDAALNHNVVSVDFLTHERANEFFDRLQDEINDNLQVDVENISFPGDAAGHDSHGESDTMDDSQADASQDTNERTLTPPSSTNEATPQLTNSADDTSNIEHGLTSISTLNAKDNINQSHALHTQDEVETQSGRTRDSHVLGGSTAVNCEVSQETALRHRRLAYFDRQSRGDVGRATDVAFNGLSDVDTNTPVASAATGSKTIPRSCTSQTTAAPSPKINTTHSGPSRAGRVLPQRRGERANRQSGGDSNTDRGGESGSGVGVEVAGGYIDGGSAREDDLDGRMKVRLVYLNDTHREVIADPIQTIAEFRQAHFAEEVANNKLVRFIYNGNVLRNDASTLQSYNIRHNSAVHCLITQISAGHQPSSNHPDDTPFDMSALMFPLFAVLLAIVWYLRFSYRRYFNTMSTFSLVVITLLFLTSYLAPVLMDNYTRRRPLDAADPVPQR